MSVISQPLTASDLETIEVPPRGAARLVPTHRTVLAGGALVLFLPNVLFALQLRLWPCVLLLTGVVGAAAIVRTRRAAPSTLDEALSLPRLAACLGLAIVLLLLGGEGHLFFANSDWLWRDAVLADLVRAPFPPTYEVGDQTFLLRAPLGMYMLPALVGKTAGLAAAHVALLAQNALLLALILYMLATIAGRRAWLIVPIFLAFSGLDALGALIMWLKAGNGLASFELPSHVENWIGLQYSSAITQLFWVPNHALPGTWLALLVVLCARRELALADLGLVMAASLFWSPFAFIGTLPFAVYLFLRDRGGEARTLRFWAALATALCFLPVALYMKADAAEVPHSFILFEPFAIFTILLFLFIEIPHLAIVKEMWREIDPMLRGLLLVAVPVLVVLPMFRLGASNDLVMRASIPALVVLAIAFGESLAAAWRTNRKVFAAGFVIALVGAITPAQEIVRALRFAPFAISDCNLVTVWKKIGAYPTLENYLARRAQVPATLVAATPAAPILDRPGDVCWPDMPFFPTSDVGRLSNDALKHDAARGGRGAL